MCSALSCFTGLICFPISMFSCLVSYPKEEVVVLDYGKYNGTLKEPGMNSITTIIINGDNKNKNNSKIIIKQYLRDYFLKKINL